ncbi:dynamin family protein [Aeromonas caviae]
MTNPLFAQLGESDLRDRYALLCQACETAPKESGKELESRLQALEQLIGQELPALARKGAPDNVADLLQALRLEMVRFREFCEFPELPGKVVVGLGGSFSAGKSSLINALVGDRKCLVTEVDPTTSLPTYLVQGKGEEIGVHALNLFNRMVPLSHAQFRTLTHEEKSLYGSQISGLLKSVVVTHPALPGVISHCSTPPVTARPMRRAASAPMPVWLAPSSTAPSLSSGWCPPTRAPSPRRTSPSSPVWIVPFPS